MKLIGGSCLSFFMEIHTDLICAIFIIDLWSVIAKIFYQDNSLQEFIFVGKYDLYYDLN